MATTITNSAIGNGTISVPINTIVGAITRLWINFNAASGSPVTQDSFAVSSVTDNAAGSFDINTASAFLNTGYTMNYGCHLNAIGTSNMPVYYGERCSTVTVLLRTASVLPVWSGDTGLAAEDPASGNLVAHGDV